MIRLQAALKGKALEAVTGMLLHPSQVNTAMEYLTEHFGSPDRILVKLTEKLQKLPDIPEHKLSAVVDMSIGVHNLCGTIQATLKPEHLHNATLIPQLVEELPAYLRMSWAIIIRAKK